jgi:hypothetical protein
MQIVPASGSTKGPREMFTGDVWFDVIHRGEPPSRIRANAVHFAPCARTNWHTHAVGQTLHVTEASGSSRPAAARSSSCVPATPCTPRPASGIGTVRPPTTS